MSLARINILVAVDAERSSPALINDPAASTRDVKAVAWLKAGVELELFDAPGFEFTAPTKDDDPDQKAQVLADATRRGADVILWLLPTDSTTPEEAAETLRAATDELDSTSGETTPEDLLDRIFAGFCLGK